MQNPSDFSEIRLKNYSIFIGEAWLAFLDFVEKTRPSQLIFVADEHTRRLCLPLFLEKTSLENRPFSLIEIQSGEAQKTISTCQFIWQKFLDFKADRNALVVCLGGGVVGDMAGFCASTWKRGLPFVQVPTTLLSMVDSSIGGKLGIDYQGVKNVVGVFRDPSAVFIFPHFLKTLPPRELRSGFAEMAKHALIGSPAQLRFFEKMGDDFEKINWAEVIAPSLEIKRRIVRRDPFEKNIRQVLNFGHTIGHAVESVFLKTENPLLHGEAVAVGLVCESWLSWKTTGLAEADFQRIATFLRRFFPKTALLEANFPAFLEAMRHDKKNADGQIRFALLEKIGRPKINVACSEALILESLHFYQTHF